MSSRALFLLALALGLSSASTQSRRLLQNGQCVLPAGYSITSNPAVNVFDVEDACTLASDDATLCVTCLCGLNVLFAPVTNSAPFLADPRLNGTDAEQQALIASTITACLNSQFDAFSDPQAVQAGANTCLDPNNWPASGFSPTNIATVAQVCADELAANGNTTVTAPVTGSPPEPSDPTSPPEPVAPAEPDFPTPVYGPVYGGFSPAVYPPVTTISPAVYPPLLASPSPAVYPPLLASPSPAVYPPVLASPSPAVVTVSPSPVPTPSPQLNIPGLTPINLPFITRNVSGTTGAGSLATAGIQQLVLALLAALLLAQLL